MEFGDLEENKEAQLLSKFKSQREPVNPQHFSAFTGDSNQNTPFKKMRKFSSKKIRVVGGAS